MNEIGYYEHDNKKYKLFFDFRKNKNYNKIIFGFLKFTHILKIQCYSKEMFEHFVNAWNLDKRKIFKKVDWKEQHKNLILLFKSDEWHETRQFIIIVEKYLNDRGIELVLDNEMIGAILMMKELGR